MTPHSGSAETKLMQLASAIYLSDVRFRICYFIPHPDQNLEEASPFQGATAGMVDTAPLLEGVMLQPADVREITASWQDIAFFRASGLITHRIYPIEHSAFRELVAWPSLPPFRCVISSEKNANFVDQFLSYKRDSWLHLSTQPADGRYVFNNLQRYVLLDYINHRLDQLANDPEHADLASVVRPMLVKHLPVLRRVSLPYTMHNLTRPNEIGLMAFGCILPEGRESPLTEDRARYWISRSVDFVDRQRRKLLKEEQRFHVVNALLLTLPSIYRGRRTQDLVQRLRKTSGFNEVPTGRLVREFINPRSYLWRVEEKDLQGFLGSTLGRELIAIRRSELKLYTAVLTRVAAESLLPTMRISPKANDAWGTLKHLADCARSEGPHKKWKMSRLLSNVQKELEGGLDDRLRQKLQLFGDQVQGIKLVCDVPLEWIRVNGLPLMLRHECSRIPTVPISLGYATATDQDALLITPSRLTNVLVIRSFATDDPIRSVLQRAIDQILQKKTAWHVKVCFVDVVSSDQVVQAINGHAGAIVVFDCHGHFEESEYLSSLVIGGEAIRLWELRKQIHRMPPIVLLSACDTLPLDGSHASVGLTMLQLGARTVLATLAPIHSLTAAVFLARLIYRIGEFVPLMTKSRSRISWREVVSGMTKMMYVTECLRHMTGLRFLDQDAYEELHTKANMDINCRDPHWFEHCADGVAKYINCSRAEAMRHMATGVGLSHAMMHVQLGNPELLWLVGEEVETINQKLAEKTSLNK